MFCTTLRIDPDLGRFLQEAARQSAMSVNAFLADLIRREQETTAKQKLAADWAAYAQDKTAQDVAYAFPLQAELAAEPKRRTYSSRKAGK